MFDTKYVEKNINIIFDTEKNNLEKNKPFCYVETSWSEYDQPELLMKIVTGTGPLVNFKLKPDDDFRLKWDTYTTLKRLYNKIENDPNARNVFINHIKEKLLNGDTIPVGKEFHDYSSLAFYFLVKIGKNNENIKTLKNIYKKEKHNRSMHGLFEDILKFIHLEPAYFDDDTLTSLKEFNSQNTYFAGSSIRDEFEEKIDSVRYKKLQNELVGINEELNIDKERVIEKIAKYGFPQES
jgi:lysyl-tRNA synthetase class I